MSNLYLNDEFMSQPFSYNYEKKDIEKMYNEYYLFNIQQLINTNIFPAKKISLSELLLRPYTCKKRWDLNTNNISLIQSSQNKLKLGYNIKEIGTYWPYAFILRPGISSYFIKYGNHRIASLKLLQVKNELPKDYSVFGFVCSETFLSNFAQDNEISNFKISPVKVYLNKELLNRAKNVKKRFINSTIIREVDKYTYLCSIDNAYDLWYACHAYSLYLRNALIQYNIPPLSIFN